MSKDTLFQCPECNGFHFNITVEGLICCASVTSKSNMEIGCGWRGYMDTPPSKDDDVIEDGFGSAWSRVCPECNKRSMVVVRPGKVQCNNCG